MLRSENYQAHAAVGQVIMRPDGAMVNMGHSAIPPDPTQELMSSQQDVHDGNWSQIIDDGRYVEKEIALFWDAPQSECLILFLVVLGLVCLDAFIAKKFKTGSWKTRAAMVVFWISCGIGYNVLYTVRHGPSDGGEWFMGYALEWMLSLDNLFAFQFIMRAYGAPPAIQDKALFCGILGAIGFRLLMFFALGFLMHSIHYVQFVFGFILIYQGVQAMHGDDADEDPNEMIFIRLLKACLGSRLRDTYDLENNHLFIWDDNGRLCATLLVPLIFCVLLSDIIFAVDSVSAKVAQIPNQYIAYSSSVFALLGLRAMYFVINDLVSVFEYLKYGVCAILILIGGEMMISYKYQVPNWVVCIIIISIFKSCIGLSLVQKFFGTPAEGNMQAGLVGKMRNAMAAIKGIAFSQKAPSEANSTSASSTNERLNKGHSMSAGTSASDSADSAAG